MDESLLYGKRLTSGDEVRLLDLEPGCDGSPLEASVEYHSLSENTSYEALSYTWGSPFDPDHPSWRPSEDSLALHDLCVADRVIKITGNLHAALSQLRRPLKNRLLWVDAICIEQSDNEEKAWQISRMQEIYSRASRVLVWLGPADATSDIAIYSLEAMYRYKLRSAPYARLGDVRVRMPPPRTELERNDELVAASVGKMFGLAVESDFEIFNFPIKAVANLLSRAYWGRGWCWQEFAVGPKMVIICGEARLEDGDKCIDSFISTFDVLRNQTKREPLVLDHRPWSMLDLRRSYQNVAYLKKMGFKEDSRLEIPAERMPLNIYAHNNPRMTAEGKAWLFRDSMEQLSMKALLQESSKSWLGTSHKEDQIWALAGVAVDAKELAIEIDCTLSSEELYTRLMAKYVERGDLWFLHYCQGTLPGRSSNLPYWVPDWSIGFRGSLISRHYFAPPDCVGAIENDRTPGLGEVDSNGHLRLRGIIVDEISWISSERCAMSINQLATYHRKRLYRWMRDVASQCPLQSRRALWTVLIANSKEIPLPQEYIESKTEEEIREAIDNVFESILDQDDIESEKLHVVAEGFLRCLMQATTWKCIFQTSSGRLGLALSGIQKGHHIAVFQGVSAPFVVQSVDVHSSKTLHYRIMCETYVHGLMEDQNLKASAVFEEIILE